MDILSLLSLIVAVASIVVAIFLYTKTKRIKEPNWAYVTTRCIAKHSKIPPKLKVYFDNVEIQQLSLTKLIFFNNGRSVILREDITKEIIFQIDGATILDKPVIYAKSPNENEFSVKENGNDISINFKYLGHQDGAAVEILHDGNTNSKVKVRGNVIDARINNIGSFDMSDSSKGEITQHLIISACMIAINLLAIVFFSNNREFISSISGFTKVPLKLDVTTILQIGGFIIVLITLVMELKYTYTILRNHLRFPKWIREYQPK